MKIETVRYYLDEFGSLWKGPVSPDDTLHYGKLSHVDCDGVVQFIFSRTYSHESWQEIAELKAKGIMQWFIDEWKRTGNVQEKES